MRGPLHRRPCTPAIHDLGPEIVKKAHREPDTAHRAQPVDLCQHRLQADVARRLLDRRQHGSGIAPSSPSPSSGTSSATRATIRSTLDRSSRATSRSVSLFSPVRSAETLRAPFGRRLDLLGPATRQQLLPHPIGLPLINSTGYADLSIGQVRARELDEGRYWCPMSSMYRMARAAGQTRERRRQATHPARVKPELVADAPSQVWSWDITKLRRPAKGVWFHLYVLIVIYSRYNPGWVSLRPRIQSWQPISSTRRSPGTGRRRTPCTRIGAPR